MSESKSRVDVRRNAEDTALVLGVHLEDGTYTAVSLFDDDDVTLGGKFWALAQRLRPGEPMPIGGSRKARRR